MCIRDRAATEKQKKKLEALQKETKAAKTIVLTVQDIEEMGKKNALTEMCIRDRSITWPEDRLFVPAIPTPAPKQHS